MHRCEAHAFAPERRRRYWGSGGCRRDGWCRQNGPKRHARMSAGWLDERAVSLTSRDKVIRGPRVDRCVKRGELCLFYTFWPIRYYIFIIFQSTPQVVGRLCLSFGYFSKHSHHFVLESLVDLTFCAWDPVGGVWVTSYSGKALSIVRSWLAFILLASTSSLIRSWRHSLGRTSVTRRLLSHSSQAAPFFLYVARLNGVYDSSQVVDCLLSHSSVLIF